MTSNDPFSDFLYPFLEPKEGASIEDKLREAQQSIVQKAEGINQLRHRFIGQHGDGLVAAAEKMASSFRQNKKVLTMGNGGSATDALDCASDFLYPPAGNRPFPAVCLSQDIGILTAVGNDVGFDNIYLRQVIALGDAGDILIGFSTSGRSKNLISAFEEAQKIGMLTIGLVGYDGGLMIEAGLDHCFVAESSYIPRIQEVHATIYHTLWHLVQRLVSSFGS